MCNYDLRKLCSAKMRLGVVDLKPKNTSHVSTEEAFIQDFIVILKPSLQNY